MDRSRYPTRILRLGAGNALEPALTPQQRLAMVWTLTTQACASKVWRALLAFGAPLQELTERDLATPELVFQIGVAPYRIDLLTSIDGVSFEEAWTHRTTVRVEGHEIPLIGRADLLRNKRATGRLRDLADAEEL